MGHQTQILLHGKSSRRCRLGRKSRKKRTPSGTPESYLHGYTRVAPDGKITYDKEPDCETESAEICSTTTFESETMVGTSTSTVTKSSSECETLYGCHLTDWDYATTTTEPVCTETGGGDRYQPPEIGCPAPAIVFPKDPTDTGDIPSLLEAYDDYVPVGSTTEDFVMFYWIPMLGQDTMDALQRSVSAPRVMSMRGWQ